MRKVNHVNFKIRMHIEVLMAYFGTVIVQSFV